MEYVFGTKGETEILRTKSDSHTNLTGFHQVKREYPDQVILDNFRIVRKIQSAEDEEGNCYDWYEIDHHYRVTDKSGPIAERLADATTALEDAMCEQDAISDERISALEDAVCELDSLLS